MPKMVSLHFQLKIVNDNFMSEDGQTLLLHAAGGGHKTLVKLLLARGDVVADSKDKDGRTPLSHAAKGGGRRAVVKLLLDRGDIETNSKDKDGRSPLSHAAGGGHKAVVWLLLTRNDVETDSKDKNCDYVGHFLDDIIIDKAILLGVCIIRCIINLTSLSISFARTQHSSYFQIVIPRSSAPLELCRSLPLTLLEKKARRRGRERRRRRRKRRNLWILLDPQFVGQDWPFRRVPVEKWECKENLL